MIGAGPAGLVAARWLLSQGFEPTIFEQGPMLGGQWSGLDGISGVWPTMHTNTSRILTSFSDLEHESDRVFPSNHDILAYLQRYAETFDLTSRIRLGTRVDDLTRGENRWLVEHSGVTEAFERVVVASGRFQSPFIPTVSGLGRSRARRVWTPLIITASPSPIWAGVFSSQAVPSAPSRSPPNSPNSAWPRRRNAAPPEVRAAEVRRGVPSDDRIFTRYGTLANETLPQPRSTASSRRSSSKPVAARSSTARPHPTRRSSRPGSPSPSSTCRWSPRAELLCGRG